MSGSDSDPFDRYHQEAKSWPDNHVEVSHDNLAWLARTAQDGDNVIRIQRIQEEQPQLYVNVWQAAFDEVSRKVLMAVAMNGGATYDDLDEWVPRSSYRTFKRRVSGLRDAGILTSEGKPARHHFATPSAKLLAEHVLARVDEAENVQYIQYNKQ